MPVSFNPTAQDMGTFFGMGGSNASRNLPVAAYNATAATDQSGQQKLQELQNKGQFQNTEQQGANQVAGIGAQSAADLAKGQQAGDFAAAAAKAQYAFTAGQHTQ